ncbi:MAG: rhomboid family intramembrane serine protease [Anaerolineaceae bacterium]|nr:MAG: rhomboid family intramembrane serine protease [Anaerolineaceae bacterium]
MNQPPASHPDLEPAPPTQTVRVRMPSLPPNVTYVIIGVTVAAYLLQLLTVALWGYAIYQIDWLEIYGARINSAIRAGELWRFITPVFLHGSVAHIFFNMYALLSIGSFLERQFGHGRFVLLYFLGAFAGNVFSFLFTGEDGYSIGASTAVFGLIGAQVVFFYQNRELFGRQARQAIGNMVFIIAINLFIGLSPGIDNWGHVGGLLGGAMFAWFASPRWMVVGTPPEMSLFDQREAREIFTGAGLAVLVFGLLAMWGLFLK